jgi:single-stranded DNA-specific DHH superfamily exonuclease
MFLTTYKEAREQLEQSQNPLFLYDNDADGLCSFLILRRWLGRGEGLAVRSYPDVSSQYLDKIDERGFDSVIVLDRHMLSDALIEGVKERGLNIIWIDHHQVLDIEKPKKLDFIYYFNPLYTTKSKNSKPVSLHAYNIAGVQKDLWLALVGCISDSHLPSFASKVSKQYPEFWAKGIKTAFDAYYKTGIGKIALSINFALKDMPSNVAAMQNFMLACKGPSDALNEGEENILLKERTGELMKKYLELVEEAKKRVTGKSLFFIYSGQTSMSSEISNALMYEFPKKYIGVAYRKGGSINVSLRGKNVKKLLEKILPEIENGVGGGHDNAVGSRIPSKYLDKFEELFRKEAEGFK